MFFFFNDTATTEIYTLSLHDALPICPSSSTARSGSWLTAWARSPTTSSDRKSTRLNSSHQIISYAVFCLKKKKGQAPDRTKPVPRVQGRPLLQAESRARAASHDAMASREL